MTDKKQNGGARPGAGRKPKLDKALDRITIRLPRETCEAVRGNADEARMAIIDWAQSRETNKKMRAD